MDSEVGPPAFSRGGILLLGVLAAFAWLMLSLFAASTPAIANDDTETGGSLLGATSDTAHEAAPLAGLSEPLTNAVEQVAEPVTTHVVKPVVTDVVKPVVTDVATPVLELPIMAEATQLLNGVVGDSAESLGMESPLTEPVTIPTATAASAVVAVQQGPVAVALTSAASDTQAAHVPAAGSHHLPAQPMAPLQPAPAPSSAPNKGAGARSCW